MKRFIVLALTLALTLAGCSGGSSGPVREITVKMGPGMIFEPNQFSATAGERLLFKIENVDAMEHDFVVTMIGRKLVLKGGESGQLLVDVKKPGTYPIVCSIPGHKEAGMTATLVVK